jgi:hypothetical protein
MEIKEIMNVLKFKVLVILVSLSFSAFAEKDYCEDLNSLWVMTQMTPVHPQSSNPRGAVNSRWFFDSKDLKVYTSFPDDVDGTKNDEKKAIPYQCENNIIEIESKNSSPYTTSTTVIVIKSITENELKLNIETSSQLFGTNTTEQIYTRNFFKSLGDRYEPVSIGVLQNEKNDLNILDIEYDNNDYSKLSLKERIIGVWEVNRYVDFPIQDMPPYGHLNDIYTIKKNEICILKRYPPEKTICHSYSLNENTLTWKIDNSRYHDTISFNEWGHLELDNNVTVQSLKLINKDNTTVPQLPLKVVLSTFNKNKEERTQE